MKELIENEVKIMKCLHHEYIINVIDYFDKAIYIKPNGTTLNVYYIALELANEGELFDIITQTGKFGEDVARYYYNQLCEGLECVHINGISHRDLKPDNLLLDSKFNLKITVFGLSNENQLSKTKTGTTYYMAPEILTSDKYNGCCVDLFAIGVILYFLATKTVPFQKLMLKNKIIKNIYNNKSATFWENKAKGKKYVELSKSLTELLVYLFSYDPIERPSLSEIMSHEWYNEPIPTHEGIIEEFTKRKAQLDEENLQKDSVVPDEVPDPAMFLNHATSRGVGEVDDEESKESIKICAAIYTHEFKRITQFFSISPIEELFNTLGTFAEKVTTELYFSHEEYSVTLNIFEEESRVSLCVNIFQVEDKEKYCVEAIMISGDRFLFFKFYNKMRTSFGGHVNATEDD